MTLKERILNDYHNKPMKEYTVFQTNDTELGKMYDEVAEVIKTGEDFNRFLNFKGAITAEGRIRFDRLSDYVDPDDRSKKVIKTKVVFKYPVYSFFYNEIKTAYADIKEKEAKIPLPV
jgi:hypothetical protein